MPELRKGSPAKFDARGAQQSLTHKSCPRHTKWRERRLQKETDATPRGYIAAQHWTRKVVRRNQDGDAHQLAS
jgi:hypothetical protein